MKSYEQLARNAFEAYRDARAVPCHGVSLTTWADLDEKTRNAWLAVARRIVAEMAAVH